MARLFLSALVLTLALTTGAAVAQTAPTTDDHWHYSVTPYVWLPQIYGTLDYKTPGIFLPPGNVSIGVNASPGNYLSHLNFAAMLAFEARRHNNSVFGDFINLNLSSSGGQITTISGPGGRVEFPISSSVNTHLSANIFTIGLGQTVAYSKDSQLDFGLGFRTFSVHSSADYSLAGPVSLIPISGSLGANSGLNDGLFIMRGRVNLAERWYVPFYGDIGFGPDNSTFQYLLGVAYAGRTNDVILAYRDLGYNQYGGEQLLPRARFAGLLLGLRVHW